MLSQMTACGQRSLGALPGSGSLKDQSIGRGSTGLFEFANHKKLKDKDLDSYIDTPLSPADRKIAHKLLAMMPENKRGDFVYVDSPMHIISNSASLLAGEHYESLARPASDVLHSTRVATSTRSAKDYQSSCSPPHPFTGSGPYIRAVSRCGYTGAIGYVEVPCNTSNLLPYEKGNTYFELRGSQGSLTEGGLQYNSDTSIQPYHRSPQGYDNGQYTNATRHYSCTDRAIGIMSGITPDGIYSFTAVGLPTTQPDGTYLSPNSTWIHAAWHYFNRQSDMIGFGSDPSMMPTPCVNCSISRVTSLAQQGRDFFPDPGYFGIGTIPGTTNRALAIHWHQVTMGQLYQPCDESQSSSTTCSLRFNTDYALWFGGYQFYPDYNVAQSKDVNLGITVPYETFEGIDPRNSTPPAADPFGPFTDPAPPTQTANVDSCTTDPSLANKTVLFYPGDYDDNSNQVPPGVLEYEHYRYRDPTIGC